MEVAKRDPHEFKPGKPPGKFKFFVLPPLGKGDKCATGTCTATMEDFYVTHGEHWIDKRPYACPRVVDEDECSLCTVGFELLQEAKEAGADKKKRSEIAKIWLPRQTWIANIFFPAVKPNPEELHNKVMYYKVPKTIFDKFDECLCKDEIEDPDDPNAFGIFFYADDDCEIPGGYPFVLKSVEKPGGFPDYGASKFLHTKTPLVVTKSGKPATKVIEKIMGMRHDIWGKVAPRDHKVLMDIVNKKLGKIEDDEFEEEEKAVAEPVEDEEEETTAVVVEDEEEEETAPPPAKKKLPKRVCKEGSPKPEPEPEPEAGDEDGDDEDDPELKASWLSLLKQSNL